MAENMADVWSTSLRYLPMILTLCAIATFGSTEQHAVGWLGQDVCLPCNFTNKDVRALHWMTGSDLTKSKASYIKQQTRSSDDRFTLKEDFSLIISGLEVSDERRYVCHVEFDSGTTLILSTILAVYALVSTPRIEQCAREPTGNEFCTLKTSNTQPFHLDCRVTGFRPNVTLEWTSSGTVKKPLGEPFQKTLPDGTHELEVTISVSSKVDEDQSYTCTVKGRATNGTYRSTTVTVLALGREVSTWTKITCVVLGLGGSMLIAVVIGRVLYRRGNLKVLRKEIRTYTFKIPGKEKERAAAHIGVFGEMGAGKSSFINSIGFAYNAEQRYRLLGRGMELGGTTIRSYLRITDCIFLFDTPGMIDYDLSHVDQIMREIGNEEEEADIFYRLNEEIHCPVFVYRHGDSNQDEAAVKFLDKFATKLQKYSGYLPMIVITHTDSLSTETKKDLEENFKPYCDKVWFFENYTDSIENKNKSVKFLKFLKAALHRCDVAIRKKHRNEMGIWGRMLSWFAQVKGCASL